MSVLSKEDRAFWDENGYVIIHEAVPPENIKAAYHAIWDFLEMYPNDEESWYSGPPRQNIEVKLYHHQAIWDNRQCPRVYKAFAEIWGMDRLWVSFDQASMSPPDRSHPKDSGKLFSENSSKQPIPMHWDIPLERPLPFAVQGVLYLKDTTAEMGAFTCVLGFHRKTEAWLANLPADADPRKQDLMSLGATPIPGKAGDLIIWHSSLPHGASLNTRRYPRVVQYITMFPVKEKDENILTHRVNAWRNNLAGLIVEATDSTWELRKEKEHAVDQTANLSPLGRKLLGLDRWESES